MDLPPFPLKHALNKEPLQAAPQKHAISDSQPDGIPGQPSVSLAPSDVRNFLRQELQTPTLDELYSNLWCVGRKDSGNIDPLNRQRVKGREIVPTEDVRLHLVWQRNKIYVKPVPVCLLNYQFWERYLTSSSDLESSLGGPTDRSVAAGFVRTYSRLIQHRLDLILAQENHLLPRELKWDEWCRFIAYFGQINDKHVAPRYHYGQLRLSRLNWAVRLFRPSSTRIGWFYEIPHWSTSLYFEEVIGPLAFAFASLSIILSSMQVVLSVPFDGLWSDTISGELAMKEAFWTFSIIILISSGIIWTLIIVIPASVLIWQLQWGFRNRDVQVSKLPFGYSM